MHEVNHSVRHLVNHISHKNLIYKELTLLVNCLPAFPAFVFSFSKSIELGAYMSFYITVPTHQRDAHDTD